MIIAPIFFFAAMQVPQAFTTMKLPQSTTQIVLVETESWDSPTGELQRFSKSRGKWVPIGEQIPVAIGRNGLAWGRGLQQQTTEEPQKKEGDSKAPAGAFGFGSSFGYGSEPPVGLKLPYRRATEHDFYVDDANAAEYNTWVTITPGSAVSWKSAESMKRNDGLYELGIVVRQNESPVVPARGSAVFLHIWRAPGAPTAGCTAMSKKNLLDVMMWLDPKQNPLLIQVPRSEITHIKLATAK